MYRGEIWWANLPDPVGSEPGYRRPVLVVQDDLPNDLQEEIDDGLRTILYL